MHPTLIFERVKVDPINTKKWTLKILVFTIGIYITGN